VKKREQKPCEHCERLMSAGRNGRRRYCSAACKQAAYRERRDGARVTPTSGKRNK